MNVTVYNQQGEKIGTTRVSAEIFNIKPKPELIHFVATILRANLRKPLAHTKTRGEVRGGGRKPWRQKGTGRARAGTIRSPLWRGGGIVFGPRKERNYKMKVNKKIKKLALKMVLTDKVLNNKLIVLDKLEIPEIKTKKIKEIFDKLPNKQNKTTLALEKKDEKLKLSARNIPYLKTILANNLNILDLLSYKYFLTTKDGLKMIEKTYK